MDNNTYLVILVVDVFEQLFLSSTRFIRKTWPMAKNQRYYEQILLKTSEYQV